MANNDRIYDAYSGEMGEEFQNSTKRRIEWIIEQAGDKRTILDVGCSQGIVSLLLAKQGKEVIGIDIQPEAIEYAEQLQKTNYSECSCNVKFVCSDVLDMFFEHQFDCIIFTEILEHLETPREILKKLASILSTEGIIIISTPFGVCDHPDHKVTYYVTNFIREISDFFSICNIEFIDQWIGAICKTKSENEAFDLVNLTFQKDQEIAFERKERFYISRLEKVKNNYQQLNEKYKKALENYDTAKVWLENNKKKYEVELKNQKQNQRELEEEIAKKDQNLRKFEEEIVIRNQELIECYYKYDSQLISIQKIQHEVRCLENQIEILKKENSSMCWKLNKIENSLLGKIGIKIYRVLKKIVKKR